jgi:TolA-binding protein
MTTPWRNGPRPFRRCHNDAILLVAVVASLLVSLLAAGPAVAALEIDGVRDAIARGQWALARAELDVLLSGAPASEVEAEARLLRAELRHAEGDIEGALADVTIIDRLGAPLGVSIDALFLRAKLLYEDDRYPESGAAFARFTRLSEPTDARRQEALWYRAEASAQSDDCATALSLYGRIIQRTDDPGLDQRARMGRGWCHRRQGQEASAVTDFARAADGPDPEIAVEARFEAGASAYRLGQHREVLEWLPGAAGDPVRRDLMMGESLFVLGRGEEAMPYLERAMSVADEATRPVLLYQTAWVKLDLQDDQAAADAFAELWASSAPDSLRLAASYGLGIALLRLEELSEAIGPLERVRQRRDAKWGAESRYALAYAYNQLGDYDRSQRAVEELRSRYPDSPLLEEASLVQGENLFLAGRYGEAVRAFRARLARGEGDRADVLFRLGAATYKMGDHAAAEEALRDLVLRYPQSPHRESARFWLAESVYRQGRLDEARELYQTIRVSDPDGPHALDALYGLAWCDFSDGDFEQAASRFGLLLDAYRGSGREDDILFRRANSLYNLRRFDAAAADYDELARRYPQSRLAERALYQKGWSLHKLDRFADAQVAFDELERRYPSSDLLPQALYWSGYALYRAQRYAPAAERFGRVAAMGAAPDSLRVQSRLRMAECYYNQSEFNQAATAYEGLTASSYPAGIRQAAFDGQIRSLERAGRLDDAEAVARRLTGALPDQETSGEALYRLGVRHMEAKRYAEGVRSLREYLKLGKPVDYLVDANRRSAEASLQLGEKLRAAEYFRNAAHHGDVRDGIDFRFEAGRLFYELGKYDLARDEFRRVVRLKPEGETLRLCRYNLGLALKETGEIDAALAEFERVGTDAGAEAGLRSDALLEAGLVARKNGDGERAGRYLCEAAELGKGPAAAEAQYWCAETDFEAERYDDAIRGFRRVLADFADQNEWGMSARYRVAESFERLNRWLEAREEYQRIVDGSDDETWTADARARLDWIKENKWIFEEEPSGDPSRW